MRVVVECAGFSPGKADLVRRAMATFKHTGGVSKFHDEIIEGMMSNGYSEEYAKQLFAQLEGFGSYGFPESHAASFALIAYASSWMKCHHPDVFCASLLNSQPMGFYAPAQIVRNAQEHGVEIRPICVNRSRWDCTLEPTNREGRFAVRLGFRMISGIRSQDVADMILYRGENAFKSIPELWRRARTSTATLSKLANGDAFKPPFGLERRDALFSVRALGDGELPLFDRLTDGESHSAPGVIEPAMGLKPMTAGAQVVEDYNHLGLTLGPHPISFLRDDLAERGLITCQDAMRSKDKSHVQVAGMVLVRQRPGSANGVCFMTIEDESGDANIVVWEKTALEYKAALFGSTMICVSGYIQREGEVVHLIARSLVDMSPMLSTVGRRDIALKAPRQPGDEFRNGGPNFDHRAPAFVKDGSLKHASRDFR